MVRAQSYGAILGAGDQNVRVVGAELKPDRSYGFIAILSSDTQETPEAPFLFVLWETMIVNEKVVCRLVSSSLAFA